MVVYRLIHAKYKNSVLSGIGAEKFGGRWNPIGTRAVYCSESVALALLEYYVHTDNVNLLPKEVVIAKIEFPDRFKIVELDKLPKGWNKYPYPAETTQIFSELVGQQNFFALKVPSAVVGVEHNYILNPLFKDFKKVDIKEFIHLPVDERLI